MRTIAALLAALPLAAAGQPVAAPGDWVTDPASGPAPAEPARESPAAAPAPDEPPPAQAAPASAEPVSYPPPPQHAPPAPQYAPPAPPPVSAAPAARPRPPKTREGWYIGFGLGGGDQDASATTAAGPRGMEGLHLGHSATTIFLNFKAGGTLTPKLLLGGDLSYISSVADDENVATTLGVMNLDAVVTYFPARRGFFLRGGLGPSIVAYAVDSDYAGRYETTASGFNVLAGLGYALWLGGQFNLTANLDVSRQWYGETQSDFADLEIEDTAFWSLWVGFDWY